MPALSKNKTNLGLVRTHNHVIRSFYSVDYNNYCQERAEIADRRALDNASHLLHLHTYNKVEDTESFKLGGNEMVQSSSMRQ